MRRQEPAKEFWSHWRERADISEEVSRMVNRPLTAEQKDRLFDDRFAYARRYFGDQEMEGRLVTEQDKAIYCLLPAGTADRAGAPVHRLRRGREKDRPLPAVLRRQETLGEDQAASARMATARAA